jgi:hypothetical protein
MLGYRASNGQIKPGRDRNAPVQQMAEVPCGNCRDCRIRRARDWAIRCQHEAQTSKKSCFATLTYNDDEIPDDLSVRKEHWQLFAKRLRKKAGKFRYLATGEYGDDTARPHYHALIFGMDFLDDRYKWRTERRGAHSYDVFRSPTIESVWPYGNIELADATFASISYVARYTVKKLNGQDEMDYLERVSFIGEVWHVAPEFIVSSRRPGLGRDWIKKYWRDVYPCDFVLVEGKKFKPPAYYDNYMKEQHPEVWDAVYRKRIEGANDPAFADEREWARLCTKREWRELRHKAMSTKGKI